jgi:putative Mn2+ efflux pump MntP
MSFLSLILIALGLSADAFAVSITNGIIINNLKFKDALKIGGYFGLFQAIMPVIGWTAGINFRDYIVKIDHWIAFILLGCIGIKMIIEAFKEEKMNDTEENGKPSQNPLSTRVLLMLAVATSIDALAVGVSFAFLDVSITGSALTIGLITFSTSTIGVLIGKKCGRLLQKKAEIIGGIILTLIGFKILIEHSDIKAVLKIFQ